MREGHVKMKAEISESTSEGIPRIVSHHRKLGRSKEGFSPRFCKQSMTLSISCSQTSSLWNCERIHFCCSKSSSLCYLVIAVLGNWYACYAIKFGHKASASLPTWTTKGRSLVSRVWALAPRRIFLSHLLQHVFSYRHLVLLVTCLVLWIMLLGVDIASSFGNQTL